MTANHYATLGVAPHSPREVIRAAYLQLMRRYHPDKNPSAEAAARARAITAAYAVLGVAEERAKYDAKQRSRRAVPQPAPATERTRLLRTASSALIAAGAATWARLLRTAWPSLIAAGAAIWARLHRSALPALIAAGAVILVLVAYAVPGWVVPEQGIERSGGAGKTITSASPLKPYAAATPRDAGLCSSGAASESIKRELFRRAGLIHDSNPAALERISGYSLVRFASPIVRTDAHEGAGISCEARVVLHLPPGVTAPGGRQSLDGIVAYSLRGGVAGGAAGLSLAAEPAMVKALAFLTETSSETALDLQPSIIAKPLPTVIQPEIAPAPALAPPLVAPVRRPQPMQPQIAPTPAVASAPVARVRRPQPEPRIAEQTPSFSCSGQRSWAEKSVCMSASLAALDRARAALWNDAMERANASQRAAMLGSGKRFVAGRNLCSSESCVHDAYLADLSNIRAIMSGTPLPR